MGLHLLSKNEPLGVRFWPNYACQQPTLLVGLSSKRTLNGG